MKKLTVLIIALMLIFLPFVSYAQIWEGDGGCYISESISTASNNGSDTSPIADIIWMNNVAYVATESPAVFSTTANITEVKSNASEVGLFALFGPDYGVGTEWYDYYSELETVSFPLATSIGVAAFAGCASLTTVSLPNATSIGSSAFNGCRSLTDISFPNATSIGRGAFYGCASLTTAIFPLATSVGENAFEYCRSLTDISLPNATSVGRRAFDGCTGLQAIYFGETPPTVESNSFMGGLTFTVYYLPGSSSWDSVIANPNWGGASNITYRPY